MESIVPLRFLGAVQVEWDGELVRVVKGQGALYFYYGTSWLACK